MVLLFPVGQAPDDGAGGLLFIPLPPEIWCVTGVDAFPLLFNIYMKLHMRLSEGRGCSAINMQMTRSST